MKFLNLTFVIMCAPICFDLVSQGLNDQDDQLEKSVDISRSSIQDGASNQNRLNEIDEATRLIEFDYRDTMKEYENLKLYNDQLQRIINSQEEEMISIMNQIDELDNININMIPIMLKMIDALDKFVSLDVPFLINERTERVSNLKQSMDRGDISTSERTK